MTVHAYVVNTLPQIRVAFPNKRTASVVITGDGTVALAHWPTHDDSELDPKKFTDADRAARAAEVVEISRSGTATELVLFLQMVEALPAPEEAEYVEAKGG